VLSLLDLPGDDGHPFDLRTNFAVQS